MSFIAGYLLGLGEGEAVTEEGLLKYVLQNAALVCTCRHTAEYSVKYYQGVICNRDPNLILFAKELDDTKNAEQFKCTKIGFINETYLEDYGTVVMLDNTQVEQYFTYFSRVLFKNDSPLYGDLRIVNTGSYRTRPDFEVIRSDLTSESTIKEIVGYYHDRHIPKTAAYIGDYSSKLEHRVYTESGIEKISTSSKFYDANGSPVDYTITLQIPFDEITYYPLYEEVEVEIEGETFKTQDRTKRPTIVEDRRYTTNFSYVFYLNELPNPDMMGNLKMADLSNIFFDYEQQRWAEATPQGYTPDAVRADILPHPT